MVLLEHCCGLQFSFIHPVSYEHLVFRKFSHGCPFQWPLLSMCSSSKSNTHKKSGTQSLSLSRAEHASQQAVSGSFRGSYALMFACFPSCHASFVFPRGATESSFWVRSPRCEDTIARRWLLFQGGRGYSGGCSNGTTPVNRKSAKRESCHSHAQLLPITSVNLSHSMMYLPVLQNVSPSTRRALLHPWDDLLPQPGPGFFFGHRVLRVFHVQFWWVVVVLPNFAVYQLVRGKWA